jgi:hypothetical protein
MAVVLVHHGPSLTQERYEETVRRLTNGRAVRAPAGVSRRPCGGASTHVAV